MPCNGLIVISNPKIYKHLEDFPLEENKQTSNAAQQELVHPKNPMMRIAVVMTRVVEASLAMTKVAQTITIPMAKEK